jgi:outer membrane protein OmpA-like peptidoglycan-associated protein
MRELVFFVIASAAMPQQGTIQQPKGTWQKPGEIQQPKGPWQKPSAIQVPKGIQAIQTKREGCEQRLIVAADALFEFNKASLTPDAVETLSALAPLLARVGNHPVIIEGYTDSIGSSVYNQELSEHRAAAVRSWLMERHSVQFTSLTFKGYGKMRPVAPNRNPDGSDNPAGRQKNRRVEIRIQTCK